MNITVNAELRKIIWLDSNACNGWHNPDDMSYGPIKVTSVGWLIAETDEAVTLAGSVVFGKDYQAADTMTIPKCCIQSDKVLAPR